MAIRRVGGAAAGQRRRGRRRPAGRGRRPGHQRRLRDGGRDGDRAEAPPATHELQRVVRAAERGARARRRRRPSRSGPPRARGPPRPARGGACRLSPASCTSVLVLVRGARTPPARPDCGAGGRAADRGPAVGPGGGFSRLGSRRSARPTGARPAGSASRLGARSGRPARARIGLGGAPARRRARLGLGGSARPRGPAPVAARPSARRGSALARLRSPARLRGSGSARRGLRLRLRPGRLRLARLRSLRSGSRGPRAAGSTRLRRVGRSAPGSARPPRPLRGPAPRSARGARLRSRCSWGSRRSSAATRATPSAAPTSRARITTCASPGPVPSDAPDRCSGARARTPSSSRRRRSTPRARNRRPAGRPPTGRARSASSRSACCPASRVESTE